MLFFLDDSSNFSLSWGRKSFIIFLFSSINSESLEGLDENEKVDRLCELNVKEQVINVCNTPVVQKVWREGGELTVHGWIYNINNGRLIDMGAVDSTDWKSQNIES